MRRGGGRGSGDAALQEMVEAQCATITMRHEKQILALRQQLARSAEAHRSLEVETRLMAKELEVMFKTEILDFTQDLEGKFAEVEEGNSGMKSLSDEVDKRIEGFKAWHEQRAEELQQLQKSQSDRLRADLEAVRVQVEQQEDTLAKSIEEIVASAKRDSAKVKRLEDRLRNVEHTLEDRLSEPPTFDEDTLHDLVDQKIKPVLDQHALHVEHVANSTNQLEERVQRALDEKERSIRAEVSQVESRSRQRRKSEIEQEVDVKLTAFREQVRRETERDRERETCRRRRRRRSRRVRSEIESLDRNRDWRSSTDFANP